MRIMQRYEEAKPQIAQTDADERGEPKGKNHGFTRIDTDVGVEVMP
jgi:hypothetical protein